MRPEIARRLDDALRLMGLVDFAKAYPAQLSGGMRQRVCIARTLVMQPRMILLDEPFGALDAQTRLVMGDELLKVWRATGATVLLITHALDEAAMLSDRIGVMSARPGRIIEEMETGWPRERDSRIAADPAFGAITARLWTVLREESLKTMQQGKPASEPMSRVGLIRLLVVGGFVAALELLCRTGAISPRVLLAPSDMAVRLAKLLASGKANADIVETLGNVAISLVLSVTGGFAIGALIHGFPRLRAAIDPFLASYYALPFFAFYPLFIVLFGLGRGAIVAIGFLFGVVAMIIATLNGFDRIPRVLLRTAEVHHMSPAATALRIKLPSAVPYLFTGVKLAIAYCFIGVIAAEFIMASSGLGYAISYAFNNFDNGTMYALMLFVIVLVTIVNALFYGYEQRLLRRWGR